MEITWPLYVDDPVLCDESEKDARVVIGRFIEVGKIRDPK